MSALTFVAVWGTAGAIAGLICLRPSSITSRGVRVSSTVSESELSGVSLCLGVRSTPGIQPVLVILLGVLAGLMRIGGFRGATTMFGPLTVMIMAASSFGVPLVRLVSEARRETAMLAMACALVGTTVVLMVVLMVLLTPSDRACWVRPGPAPRRTCQRWVRRRRSHAPPPSLHGTAQHGGATLDAPPSCGPGHADAPKFCGGLSSPVDGGAWGIAAASASQAAIATVAYSRLRRRRQHMASVQAVLVKQSKPAEAPGSRNAWTLSFL